MNLSSVAAGATVFPDANVLVYHFAPDPQLGPACTDLLVRICKQEIIGYTSTHVLSEMAHRLMTLEAMRTFGWPVAAIAQRLRQHPAEVQTLTAFRRALQEIPQHGIRTLTIPSDLVEAAAAISQQTGLLSNDALIVAIMRRHSLVNLASGDADFDRVPGISRYDPA